MAGVPVGKTTIGAMTMQGGVYASYRLKDKINHGDTYQAHTGALHRGRH